MPIDASRDTGMPSEGTHLFKVSRAEEKQNGEGHLQWIVELTCQDSGSDQGLKYTEFFFVEASHNARWKFNQFLDGVDAPKKGSLEVGWLMNKLLRVTIVHDEWEGVKRPKGKQYHLKTSTVNPEIKHETPRGNTAAAEFGSKKTNPF